MKKKKPNYLVSEKELRWLLKHLEKRPLGSFWIVRLAKTLEYERKPNDQT